MVIEVANADERRFMETLLKAVRDLGSSSCLTVVREELIVKAWVNGRHAGRIALSNALPAWKGLQVR